MSDAAKAFVSAQREMGRAYKGKANPHFKSKYATLGDVMDACYPALHQHGFAVLQPQGRDEHGDFVETVFIHESGERFSSRVYLLIGKQDMQGKGSAVTYARRYGLIALAGLADTDDDGNAACEPPSRRQETSQPDPAAIEQEVARLRRVIPEIGSEDELASFWRNLPDALRTDRIKSLCAARKAELQQQQAGEAA